MTPEDQKKIDEITAAFVKALINNKMEDNQSYVELAKRLAGLLDCEIRWQMSQEENRVLMQAWGSLVN